MSIEYTGISQNLTASNVIYYSDNTIKALAQAVMISMAEANVDMIADMPEEYPNKADVEGVFQGLHDQAHDMINDCFDDLKARLLQELSTKKYTAVVKSLHYTDDGRLDDVGVKITFE